MTIALAANFGVSQRAPQQTLPGILGIEAGKSADVALAQLRPQFRGGLSPGVLRRVREWRAFKQSEGVAPHDYLMRRRLHRALELLVGTDLPLSAIASASGFSDQSHFARRFRQHFGVAPSRYRWSTR